MENTKKWELSTSEVGKAVGTYTDESKVFKVHIAKILPLVKFGEAKVKNVPLNKNCFLNTNKCKLSLASQVKSVNYILVNAAPLSKLPGKIPHGTKLKINVSNHNIDRLNVVSVADKMVN